MLGVSGLFGGEPVGVSGVDDDVRLGHVLVVRTRNQTGRDTVRTYAFVAGSAGRRARDQRTKNFAQGSSARAVQ